MVLMLTSALTGNSLNFCSSPEPLRSRGGLSIGEFSQITHLSVKTLRRYREAGLLQPAEVDSYTGYRYRRPERIRGLVRCGRLAERLRRGVPPTPRTASRPVAGELARPSETIHGG
jgi:hypothetical protein